MGRKSPIFLFFGKFVAEKLKAIVILPTAVTLSEDGFYRRSRTGLTSEDKVLTTEL